MTASLHTSTHLVLPEDAPLLANMAALWATDPALAAELENLLDKEAYPVEPTRTAAPTVSLPTADGHRIHLHSRYNPLDEAKRLIEASPLDGKIVFGVLGLGLGYHVEALFQQASDESLILVFEPDLRLIRTALEHRDYSEMIRSGRVLLLTHLDRGRLMIRLNAQQGLFAVGFSFIPHGPSMQLHAEFHRQAQTWMTEFVAYCRTSLNTLVLNSRRTCENIAQNLGWYVTTGNINQIKDRHAGRPAIIVSAGPSLRKNKHLLKDAAGKAVIIAVQTMLQPLLEMGIEPDYVTSLDYHEICTRFFEKLPRSMRCHLVAEPKAAASVLELYPGPITMIGNDFAEKLLMEMQPGKGTLRAGATVAHLAFYLAEHLGCDPVIFVGQDLGFGEGLCYAPGTSYEDVWRPELGWFCTVEMKQWEQIVRERPILRKVEDWQGRPMYTEERLAAYLQQFERDFAATRARVIDATEGGVMKRGATPMNLADALRQFCRTALPRSPGNGAGADASASDSDIAVGRGGMSAPPSR